MRPTYLTTGVKKMRHYYAILVDALILFPFLILTKYMTESCTIGIILSCFWILFAIIQSTRVEMACDRKWRSIVNRMAILTQKRR